MTAQGDPHVRIVSAPFGYRVGHRPLPVLVVQPLEPFIGRVKEDRSILAAVVVVETPRPVPVRYPDPLKP